MLALLLQYGLPAASLIIVAIIEAMAARERKQAKQEKRHRDEQEKGREELLLLLVQSTSASIALGEATGHAMQRGHTNGDMEAALEYAQKVKRKQKEFLAQQGIHALLE